MKINLNHPYQYALMTVAIFAFAFGLLITIGANRFNLVSDNAYNWMTDHNVNYDKHWEYMLSLWDGRWYTGLAKNGYQFDPNGLSNVAFLPLYPFLLRTLTLMTQSYTLSGLLINFGALFGAVYFLIQLGKKEKMSDLAIKDAIFFMLIYPTAIFFAATYTEALFMFLTLGSFCFMKQKHWFLAALFGMLAALTRISGVFLLLPFAYYLWQSKESWKTYALGILMPLGTGVYMLLQKLYTGHALAFLTAQKNWGRNFGHFNPDHLYWKTAAGTVNSSLDIAFATALLLGCWYVYKKLDLGYAIFCAMIVLVPLATGTLLSIGRFGMVLFPIAMAVAKTERAWVKRAYSIICLVLVTFYTIQFVNGYWAG